MIRIGRGWFGPLLAGNGCGHDVCAPRLVLPGDPHKHWFIQAACERIIEWRDRVIECRSELKEAVTLVLQFLVRNMDLRTLRVVARELGSDRVLGIEAEDIAKATQLNLSRVKSALRALTIMQVIRSKQPREKLIDWNTGKPLIGKDGKNKYTAWPAVRVFDPNFFRKRLEMAVALKNARDWKTNKDKAEGREKDKRERDPAMRSHVGQLSAGTAPDAADRDLTDRAQARIQQLKREHPDWDMFRVRTAAFEDVDR